MQKPEPMPIACTLDLQSMGPRLAGIQRLTRDHLRSHRLDRRTLQLTYSTAAANDVARIVELERMCCAFLEFDIQATANEVTLAQFLPRCKGSRV